MSHIDKESLKALAKLCRIECDEEALEKLLKNLKSILNYMDLLKEVDTEEVPECNHVLESVQNVMREDKTEETLNRETFLANSPSHVGGMIRVPPVIKF
ncbi:Asp-tRNA(Asn)/Glu-tRNA(Gln) amidotransferase subunit GatC [Simkania sp.]|uniref:Asp-tRNA(Asn)/Glu-tRNA(Gln) amidotransferase subunit GatC n=1 Tax=Simkania sp. TaxID=34094 RepID=UPI003B525C47